MNLIQALQEFGTYIRKAREDAGLTQYALGCALGFSGGQFVSNVERGLRQMPSAHIRAVATALNLQPSELMERMLRIESAKLMDKISA